MTVRTSEHHQTSVELTAADLDLIAALQVSPRAENRLLAAALGVSVATVSRRLRRLQQQRVLGFAADVPWWARSQTHPQHIWIETEAGRTPAVAAEISQLPDAQYVALTTGGADVYCVVHPYHREQVPELLSQRLPSIRGVLATRTEVGLGCYATGAGWRLRRLDATQELALGGVTEPNLPASTPVQLRDDERAVLRLLQVDGRTSAASAARTLGTSTSTAYRLITSLLQRRILVPRVEVEPGLLGHPLEVVVSLVAAPGQMPQLATTLAEHPAARYIVTVAGRSSVLFHSVFAHERNLADFLAADMGTLPGVVSHDVSVVLDVVTRYWGRREEKLHAEPLS